MVLLEDKRMRNIDPSLKKRWSEILFNLHPLVLFLIFPLTLLRPTTPPRK